MMHSIDYTDVCNSHDLSLWLIGTVRIGYQLGLASVCSQALFPGIIGVHAFRLISRTGKRV